jgi:O-antigen/teichoic acid export membrane protein
MNTGINQMFRGKGAAGGSGKIDTLAWGTGISFFAEISHVVIMYGYGILIARFLGSSGYGNFFLGVTIFNVVCLFSMGGLEDTLIRFIGFYSKTGKKEEANAVIRLSFLIALGASTGLGILCFLLKNFLANQVFHKPELANVLGYLCIAIPVFVMMTISIASIRSYKIIFPYVFVQKIFFPVVNFVLAFLILSLGFGLQSLSVMYLLSVGLAACLAYIFFTSYLSPFTGNAGLCLDRKEYFSFLTAAYLSNILIFFLSLSDLIILGVMSSSEQVGIYFAAKKTALTIGILLISLNVILGPVISHLYSGKQYDQLSHAYKTGTQWIVALGLPVLLMILFFSREILSLFGPAFISGQLCLIILSLGQFTGLSVGSVAYMLLMTGHQTWVVFNALGAFCFNMLLMVILVPRYGIIGAAWATGTTMVLGNIIALVQVYWLLGLHPYNLRYFKLFLIAFVTAGFTWAIKLYIGSTGSILVILAQVLFIYICFFTLLLLFGLSEGEKRKILEIRNKPLPILLKSILE